MGILPALLLEFLVGILLFRKFLEIIHHRMADRVGKRSLFAVENVVRQIIALECVAEQILALAVFVEFPLGVDGHDVFDKVEVAERDPGLERVDADAAVGAEDIVHMKLADALFGLLLELLRRGRKVGVFITEQLVGNFTRQDYAQVGVFVDPLAKKIHAHARADGRNIIRAQHPDDLFQTIEHLLLRHIDLGVLASDVVCHLLGVFEVDRVLAHADGKRADGRIRLARSNCADERRIEAAREQEPDLRVGHEPLFDTANELVVNLGADRIQIVVTDRLRLCDVAVADELAVLVVMSGRERHDLVAERD